MVNAHFPNKSSPYVAAVAHTGGVDVGGERRLDALLREVAHLGSMAATAADPPSTSEDGYDSQLSALLRYVTKSRRGQIVSRYSAAIPKFQNSVRRTWKSSELNEISVQTWCVRGFVTTGFTMGRGSALRANRQVAIHNEFCCRREMAVTCAPHSAWQRGFKETTHGLVRQTEGTGLSGYRQGQLDAVADQIDDGPRKAWTHGHPSLSTGNSRSTARCIPPSFIRPLGVALQP